MNINEIIDFLLPDFSDPIQGAFLIIMATLIFITILSTHVVANPTSWNKKWVGSTDDSIDDLDIEHGSVTELWQAVATAPEKLADIMPGMLLVIGLLGTFLGLGLALNHASNILGQPNAMSASGAVNSMHDLMGLLQGLGTKFKTSTWGISGFIFLKIWSEIARFDERRLSWVINRVKVEIQNKKRVSSEIAQDKKNEWFCKLDSVAKSLTSGFSNQMEKSLVETKTFNTELVGVLLNGINEIKSGAESNNKLTLGVMDSINDNLVKAKSSTLESNDMMRAFSQSTRDIISGMADAGHRMAGGADNVGHAAEQLVNAIDDFKEQFTDVLDNVRNDLGAAIVNMSAQASDTLEKGSQQLGDATHEISIALGNLSNDVKLTMDEVKSSINRALDIQKNASIAFTSSTDALNENIATTTGIVGDLATPITDGLAAISASNRQLSSVGKAMNNSMSYLETVVDNLNVLSKELESLRLIEKATGKVEGILSEVSRLNLSVAEVKKIKCSLDEILTKVSCLDDISASSKGMLNNISEIKEEMKSTKGDMGSVKSLVY